MPDQNDYVVVLPYFLGISAADVLTVRPDEKRGSEGANLEVDLEAVAIEGAVKDILEMIRDFSDEGAHTPELMAFCEELLAADDSVAFVLSFDNPSEDLSITLSLPDNDLVGVIQIDVLDEITKGNRAYREVLAKVFFLEAVQTHADHCATMLSLGLDPPILALDARGLE